MQFSRCFIYPSIYVQGGWNSKKRHLLKNIFLIPLLRRKEKAPYKIEPGQQRVLTRFRTALGRFSVLTDPALLARLEIVFRYSVFRRKNSFTTPPDNMIVTALFQKSKNYVFHLDPKSKFLDLPSMRSAMFPQNYEKSKTDEPSERHPSCLISLTVYLFYSSS